MVQGGDIEGLGVEACTAHPLDHVLVPLILRVGVAQDVELVLVALNAAGVLGRSGASTSEAARNAREGGPILVRIDELDPMHPVVTEIIEIADSLHEVGEDAAQRDAGFVLALPAGPADQVPHRIDAADLRGRLKLSARLRLEPVQVVILPLHDFLDEHVQVPEREVRGHRERSPDERFGIDQPEVDLVHRMPRRSVGAAA